MFKNSFNFNHHYLYFVIINYEQHSLRLNVFFTKREGGGVGGGGGGG